MPPRRSTRGHGPGTPVGGGRAAPEDATRIRHGNEVEDQAGDDSFDQPSGGAVEESGWGLPDDRAPVRGPRGFEVQPRTSVYSGRHAKPSLRSGSQERFDGDPIFADADDLAPFSVGSAKAQPLYAPADPEVLELLTSDIDLSDLTDENEALDGRSSDSLDGELGAATFQRDAAHVGLSAARPIPQSAPHDVTLAPRRPNLPPERPSDAAVPALQLSRRPVARDFDEDLATRVRAATSLDPSLELSLVDIESPDGRRDAAREFDPEKSVVRRIVKSVVAHLPRAIQSAASKSGLIKLSSGHPASQGGGGVLATQDLRTLGIDPRAWREARTAPIFDGLPNDALRDALLERKLQILRVDRDTIIPVGGGLVLVRTGQVALAQFPPDLLEIEREVAEKLLTQNPLIGKKLDKKERRRRVKAGPLMRMAEKNLATFEEGDVVEISAGARRHDTLGIYSVTPVTAFTIDRAVAERWRQSFPFMADRLRRAGASARARVEATGGAKAIVADFFIRHGLSVSMTLRVRKLDTCIECGACEKACEDRYGAKRLSLNGRILGNLDFVDACHTCTDQRCIDPCNFDAISFDAQRKEVLINEANCTGCTLCAVACPYDAIEMYELDDKPKLQLRLEKSNALAFGDGAGRKAVLRRIASKCDHCAFYEDQACISACPTGALIEILPSDVVSQMPDQARATARAGFDRTVRVDINALNQVDHFAKRGLSQLPELGRARARRGRLSINFWWFFGVASFLAVCAEIALRKFAPARSVAYLLLTRVEGFDHELAIDRVDFRPGCELAVNLGYVGTALMITGLIYVWRRRMPFMRNVGSLRAWFDWHVLSGVLGPSFILLHTAAKLDNWVSLAFWSMIVTVLSGLLGRYLTTQLPQAASVATVETLEVDRQLGKLRIESPGVRVVDGWFEDYRRRLGLFEQRLDGPLGRTGKREPRPASVGDGVVAAFWMFKDDLARGGRSRRLSRSLAASVSGPEARRIKKRAHKLAMRLERLERRRVLLPRLEPLFLRWKAIHVPMAIALTVIATIHIFVSLTRS